MLALIIPQYNLQRNNLVLVEKPVPQPGRNQLLIQIAASPINPSDVVFLAGQYGVRKPLPTTPGFEASGRVVAAGDGLMAKALLGRRVACGASDDQDGAWAHYMVTRADRCMPLLPSVSDEQGAMSLVNPLTAWGLLDTARQAGHRAIVQSAAASAVGRMVLRLGLRFGMPMVHIVRRPAQVELLRDLGAEYVLNSSEEGFAERLRQLCHDLQATMAFDAVAGELTGTLLQAMPRHSRVLVYGGLSGQPSQVGPTETIFGEKVVAGFWLSSWLPKLNFFQRLRVGVTVQQLLGDELRTEVQARVPLWEAQRGLKMYTQQMTTGKVLIVPHGS